MEKKIEEKFRERLISKPIYEYTSNEINVVIYEYERKVRIDIKKKRKLAYTGVGSGRLLIYKKREEIRELESEIREEIGKPIKINVIKLKYLQSDTRIMCRYYQIGLKNNSLTRMRKKVKRMIRPLRRSIIEKHEKYSTN